MKITLKSARVNKGLTLHEASILIGVNISTMWRWEQSATIVKAKHQKKIAEVYGIDIENIDWEK